MWSTHGTKSSHSSSGSLAKMSILSSPTWQCFTVPFWPRVVTQTKRTSASDDSSCAVSFQEELGVALLFRDGLLLLPLPTASGELLAVLLLTVVIVLARVCGRVWRSLLSMPSASLVRTCCQGTLLVCCTRNNLYKKKREINCQPTQQRIFRFFFLSQKNLNRLQNTVEFFNVDRPVAWHQANYCMHVLCNWNQTLQICKPACVFIKFNWIWEIKNEMNKKKKKKKNSRS